MARTERNRKAIGIGNAWMISFFVGLIFLCDKFIEVDASIHEYRSEIFIPKSNGFFFHGGSEALLASKVHGSSSPNSTDKSLKGKSFIR